MEKRETDAIFSKMHMEQDKAKPTTALVTLQRTEWEGMTRQQQREVFRNSSVHVKGRPDSQILPDVSDLSCVEGIGQAIELKLQLFCHSE